MIIFRSLSYASKMPPSTPCYEIRVGRESESFFVMAVAALKHPKTHPILEGNGVKLMSVPTIKVSNWEH